MKPDKGPAEIVRAIVEGPKPWLYAEIEGLDAKVMLAGVHAYWSGRWKQVVLSPDERARLERAIAACSPTNVARALAGVEMDVGLRA